ncbi:hypothetical protein GCM10022393_08950 [Aquimarina addita]|uniref:Uncharacterized protein n=1 Tax=Aquimarina addita TaxID=870485 RepID=A0ABP7XCB3_9FLAO
MKIHTNYFTTVLYFLCISLLFVSCQEGDDLLEDNLSVDIKNVEEQAKAISHSDEAIAVRYAPIFFQDVDITDGWCSNQSKSGSADWITKVDYDGD